MPNYKAKCSDSFVTYQCDAEDGKTCNCCKKVHVVNSKFCTACGANLQDAGGLSVEPEMEPCSRCPTDTPIQAPQQMQHTYRAPEEHVGSDDKRTFTVKPSKTLRTFTRDEVEQHCIETNDCWIIAHGIVYDATAYVPMHPAGLCILKRCGGDGTRDFDFHTKMGQICWKELEIGRLKKNFCMCFVM